MLEHVVGPEVIDKLILRCFKAIEELKQNTHHPWRHTLEPNTRVRLRASKGEMIYVAQVPKSLLPINLRGIACWRTYKLRFARTYTNFHRSLREKNTAWHFTSQLLFYFEYQGISWTGKLARISRKRYCLDWIINLNKGNGCIQLSGFKSQVSEQAIKKLKKGDLKRIKEWASFILASNLLRCKTTKEYAACAHAWISGCMYATDKNEHPIKSDLVQGPIDKLKVCLCEELHFLIWQDLCRRGLIPLQILLYKENPTILQKDTFIGFVPKEWVKEIGKVCVFSMEYITDRFRNWDIAAISVDVMRVRKSMFHISKSLIWTKMGTFLT